MNTATNTLQTTDLTKGKEILGGIITGQIAGLIMAAVVVIVFTVFLGTAPLYPVQVIGSMALGKSALDGFNFAAVLVGVLLHQAGPSLLWGTIFGFAASAMKIEDTKRSLYLGLVIGVISMVGPYLLIPTLMNAFHGEDFWNQNVPMFWDWAAHIVFGAAFVLYPKVLAKMK
ncbi:MAG: hypothetical protein ACJ76H_08870 [Bacteriovoracaceae bacterium]